MLKLILFLPLYFAQADSPSGCPLGRTQNTQIITRLVQAAEEYRWPDSVKEATARNSGYGSWEELTQTLQRHKPNTGSVVIGALTHEEQMNPWEAFYKRHLSNLARMDSNRCTWVLDDKNRIVEWRDEEDEARAVFFYDSVGNLSRIEFGRVPNAPDIVVDDFARMDHALELFKNKYLSGKTEARK